MAGVVLETLSWKKLTILGVSLLVLLISFFLVGGIFAPAPSNTIYVIGTKCLNLGGTKNREEWFIPRGGPEKCVSVDSLDDPKIHDNYIAANQVVFSFWIPHPRKVQLDFSRWQQYLIAILQLDIEYDPKVPYEDGATITLDARIGYRDKEDGPNGWKEHMRSLEERKLECTLPKEEEGFKYECDILPLFELGSVHYDYYLINIKVPVEPYSNVNMNIGKLTDMSMVAIHQNGGFTKVWVSIKSVMFPLVLAVLVWFWRRIGMLSRQPTLLERTLFALGIVLSILNCPLEYLTLLFNMPYMLLITDIRQGAFYATLCSFWIIFTGEHIMDQMGRNSLRVYWKHLLAVVIGCFCLLLFELSERGVQLVNPFFSIWVSGLGSKLALGFIIIAGIAAASYFFFLCYMIFLVFRNMSAKKTALPSMSSGRRIYYMGLIYRFKFLMLTTLVCSALTVVFFIMSQLGEGQWRWMDEDKNLEFTSAFFTGVYGMWNVYVIGLLSLYAPSHKQVSTAEPADAGSEGNSQEEEVQLTYMPSSTETSALQSFVTKAATD